MAISPISSSNSFDVSGMASNYAKAEYSSKINIVQEKQKNLSVKISAFGQFKSIVSELQANIPKVFNEVNIKNFVDTYNKNQTTLKSISGYNTAEKTSGVLSTDRNVRNSLNNINKDMSKLSEFGISISRNGQLALDSTKLSTALADPEKVSKMESSFKVLGSSFGTSLLVNGDSKLSQLNSSLKNLDSEKLKLTNQMAEKEQVYLRQFNNLDSLIGKFQNTANFLTQQFSQKSMS